MPEAANLRELHDDNPVIMAEVVAGLLAGRTARDVAETAGINRNRITAWYRDSEVFRKMLEDTTADLVSMIRAEVVSETADRMANLLPAAVDVLEGILGPDSDAKHSERITAAAHVMRFAGLGAKKDAPKAGPSPEDLIRGPRGPATGD